MERAVNNECYNHRDRTAKSVFQLHGVDAKGAFVSRKKLPRSDVLNFLRGLPRCLIGLEACATAHFWAREIGALGHDVRLIVDRRADSTPIGALTR